MKKNFAMKYRKSISMLVPAIVIIPAFALAAITFTYLILTKIPEPVYE